MTQLDPLEKRILGNPKEPCWCSECCTGSAEYPISRPKPNDFPLVTSGMRNGDVICSRRKRGSYSYAGVNFARELVFV